MQSIAHSSLRLSKALDSIYYSIVYSIDIVYCIEYSRDMTYHSHRLYMRLANKSGTSHRHSHSHGIGSETVPTCRPMSTVV